jgi:hypothetical protein
MLSTVTAVKTSTPKHVLFTVFPTKLPEGFDRELVICGGSMYPSEMGRQRRVTNPCICETKLKKVCFIKYRSNNIEHLKKLLFSYNSGYPHYSSPCTETPHAQMSVATASDQMIIRPLAYRRIARKPDTCQYRHVRN